MQWHPRGRRGRPGTLLPVPWLLCPRVLAIELRDVERDGRLRRVRMLGTLVDLEIAHQLALQRTAREHALDGELDYPLGELAFDDPLRRGGLDAARVAGVAVVDLVRVL